MEYNHHKEKNYWDSVGKTEYVSLSEYDQQRMYSWIGSADGKRILDIGGGSGMAGSFFSEQDVYCLDLSRQMLKHSSAINVQANALKLPFKSESFDLIIAAAFFHHLPQQHGLLLKECYRVLRPGGRIVGYDPNLECVANRLFMGKNMLRLSQFSPEEEPILPGELSRLATEEGFNNFHSFLFTFRNSKMSFFEVIQRYILNGFSVGGMKKYVERWFFWQAVRSPGAIKRAPE
ncbi:MAG: methyltransferase domain-containing protein [Alteromonadaceae bacterium]|nr:methyltransferase domain-containing protein [Alteromonadaceae bacterium]